MVKFKFNPLSANSTKWSNTLKQFVGKLPTNSLSVFDHFVKLAHRGFKFHRTKACCSRRNTINEVIFRIFMEKLLGKQFIPQKLGFLIDIHQLQHQGNNRFCHKDIQLRHFYYFYMMILCHIVLTDKRLEKDKKIK